ncbi:MAG: DUF5683 domain-containing protein [Candidatus Krumholzibacteria bacterium]|nr:DUF5683 domain-containing protein [Candidatus Krumholzibacteria bacterium]
MSFRRTWSRIQGAWLVCIGVAVLLLAGSDRARAQSVPDSLAGAARDTAAAGSPDTVLAAEHETVWQMDELKRMLTHETAGLHSGGKYEEPKSGRVAMLCALLVPGLGQMYNEKPVKAAVAVGLESFYLGHVFINRRLWDREKDVRDIYDVSSREWLYHDRWVKEYWERSVDWIWWSSAVIFAIVIDAYVDAHLDDMRFKVEPRAMEGGAGVSILVPY